jgi:hypothetical protein
MTRHLTTTPSQGNAGDLEPRSPRAKHAPRHVLGALLAFAALNAFAGGYYGLAGAKGVPREWLRGSPFADYFVPGLVLFVIVGGALLLATVAVFARWRHARVPALAAGVIVLGWLSIQVAVIGYVSWMQPATAIGGALILALAWRLPPAAAAFRVQRRTT